MPAGDAAAKDRAEENGGGAGVLGVALQRQHVGMAIDNAGSGGVQRAGAGKVRLHGHCLGGGQHAHAFHPVRLGTQFDAGEHRVLACVRGDDQLAAIAVRNVFLDAVGIQHAPPGDAKPCHQAVGGVVDTGVNDLGIARRGLGADPLRRLQNNDLAPGHRQCSGHGQTDNPGAGNDAIDFFHGIIPQADKRCITASGISKLA